MDHRVQGQPGLCSKFQDGQSYRERPYLKKTKNNNNKRGGAAGRKGGTGAGEEEVERTE